MAEEQNLTTVASRLEYLASLTGEASESRRAKALGLKRTTFQNILKRGRIGHSTAQIVALTARVRPEWLINGTGPMRDPAGLGYSPESIPGVSAPGTDKDAVHFRDCTEKADVADFVFLPRMAAVLSAGGGAYPSEEVSDELFAFRRGWLGAISSGVKNVFLMYVSGDSMSPTIDDGDIVLVDAGKRRLWSGLIYAIGYGDVIMVKRLDLTAGGVARIISDNKELFPPEIIDPRQLRIIGQVLWVGKTLVRASVNNLGADRR